MNHVLAVYNAVLPTYLMVFSFVKSLEVKTANITEGQKGIDKD